MNMLKSPSLHVHFLADRYKISITFRQQVGDAGTTCLVIPRCGGMVVVPVGQSIAREAQVMRVIVLGSGVIGVATRVLPGRGGARGRRPRPAGGAGARNQLCQCWRGLARLCLALGGAGHSDQGAEVAIHAPPAAVHLAEAGSRPDPLGLADADELHCRPLRDQQGSDGAAGRVQPRPAARPAGRARHRLRRAQPGYPAAVPHPEDARRHRQGHRDPAEVRRTL